LVGQLRGESRLRGSERPAKFHHRRYIEGRAARNSIRNPDGKVA